MSNPEKIKHDFHESVNEIVSNTRKIKGEQFVTAVSIIFNMHQMMFALASMTSKLENEGRCVLDDLPEIPGIIILAESASSSAALLGSGFEEKQAEEVGSIAKTLGDLYAEFIKKMNGG